LGHFQGLNALAKLITEILESCVELVAEVRQVGVHSARIGHTAVQLCHLHGHLFQLLPIGNHLLERSDMLLQHSNMIRFNAIGDRQMTIGGLGA